MFIMAVQKGARRYQHNITGEVKYFKSPPPITSWSKVGTPGSKNWRWVNNGVEEQFINSKEEIPAGFQLGRIKT